MIEDVKTQTTNLNNMYSMLVKQQHELNANSRAATK